MARNTQPTAEGVGLLMPYFNNFLGAIEAGMSRPQIWSEIQAAEAEGGPQISGASIFDFNYIYTQARGVLNAQDAFGRLNPGDAISSDSWSLAPWAQRTAATFADPQFLVRYEWQGQTPEGVQVSGWFSTDFANPAGPGLGLSGVTKDTLIDRALGSAQLALDSYQSGRLDALGLPESVSITGIGNVQILGY